MIVDFDGRVLSQAEPGPGERIVVAPIDLEALRLERSRRRGHDMPSHLRTELYRGYENPIYPRASSTKNWPVTIEGNNRNIASAKAKLGVGPG